MDNSTISNIDYIEVDTFNKPSNDTRICIKYNDEILNMSLDNDSLHSLIKKLIGEYLKRNRGVTW